jgi:hypothetical protein
MDIPIVNTENINFFMERPSIVGGIPPQEPVKAGEDTQQDSNRR